MEVKIQIQLGGDLGVQSVVPGGRLVIGADGKEDTDQVFW